MSPQREIPLSGSYNAWSEGYTLPDLLLSVCHGGRHGELKFMSSEAEKTIVIHDEQIVFAKSSSTDDRLGPYLLRENLIRFEHLTELSRFVSPEKRFGTVLVENGVLDPHQLVQGVVGQVRSIVLSLFRWTEAAYIFEPRELEKEDITLRIPIAKLIIDGVRQVTSWRRVTGGIGSLDAVYETVDGAGDAVERARLEPTQLELINDLRGPKTIAEACAGSELSDFEVCQLLWAFRVLGWVIPVTETSRPAARPEPESVIVAEPAPSPPPQPEPTPVVEAQADAVPVVEATIAGGAAIDPTEDEDLEGLSVLKEDPLA